MIITICPQLTLAVLDLAKEVWETFPACYTAQKNEFIWRFHQDKWSCFPGFLPKMIGSLVYGGKRGNEARNGSCRPGRTSTETIPSMWRRIWRRGIQNSGERGEMATVSLERLRLPTWRAWSKTALICQGEHLCQPWIIFRFLFLYCLQYEISGCKQ